MNTLSITVVFPTFNSMEFGPTALESILAQDYPHMQVWACDNESTDGTYEYLQSAAETDERLTVFSLPNVYQNGYPEAWHHAFQNVETDYLTFVASDDMLSSEYLSNCMGVISRDPSRIKCMQSDLLSMNADGTLRTDLLAHRYSSIDEFKRLCMQRSPVNTPSVIYHRELYPYLERAALNDAGLDDHGPGDFDMYCNLADNGIFIYPVPQWLGYIYRWHEGQSTWKIHNDPELSKYHKIIETYWRKKWEM